jgi:hypothetical protein
MKPAATTTARDPMMTDASFTPVLYVKPGCPFSLKVRLFLLEAGLLDKIQLRGASAEDHEAVRAELASAVEKVSFPTAQVAPGRYLQDSDAIVAHFAKDAGIDPGTLPTFRAYVEGPFQSLMSLYRENMELKKQLG